jgi:hypothetical protein
MAPSLPLGAIFPKITWYENRQAGQISLWINVPIIFTAFPIAGILATEVDIKFGLWMAYFSVVNASGHVVFALLFRGYNPGVVVSLLLNIPVGIYTIFYLTSHNLVSTTANVVGLLIGVAIQAAVMFYGFVILKPRIRSTQIG